METATDNRERRIVLDVPATYHLAVKMHATARGVSMKAYTRAALDRALAEAPVTYAAKGKR